MVGVEKVQVVMFILESLKRLGYESVVAKFIPALEKTLSEILGSKLKENK